MRLLDYQRYDVEVGEGYVWFEAPMRDKPSGNRLERVYQRIVAADARARATRTGASGATSYIYPNTTIDLYPDQVTTWQINPTAAPHPRQLRVLPRRARRAARCARSSASTTGSTTTSRDEDAELVARVQAGMATRGWRPGPLGEREAAVAWFADRVRRDLEAGA